MLTILVEVGSEERGRMLSEESDCDETSVRKLKKKKKKKKKRMEEKDDKLPRSFYTNQNKVHDKLLAV